MKKIVWVLPLLLLFLRITLFYHTRKTFPDGTKVRITSFVYSEPIRYSNTQYLKMTSFKIYLPLYPEINYGDRVVVQGIVEGDRLKDARLVELEEARGGLYGFRRRLLEFYQESLPSPHSSLISGVTIGSKSEIPEDFWQTLKISGTAHVVVASGMNVTLLAGFFLGVLVWFLPRRKAIPWALAGVWMYSIVSGFDAPIVRAAIMGSLSFVAQELGRLNLALRALAFSAFIMLFINPGWISDLGFLLSFFATLALILFEPKVYKLIYFVPESIRVFKKDFSTSLSASLGVAPILFFNFRQFNVLSPLVNSLVLWTIPFITIIGMVGGILGLVIPLVGRGILLLAYPLTGWFILIVNLFG